MNALLSFSLFQKRKRKHTNRGGEKPPPKGRPQPHLTTVPERAAAGTALAVIRTNDRLNTTFFAELSGNNAVRPTHDVKRRGRLHDAHMLERVTVFIENAKHGKTMNDQPYDVGHSARIVGLFPGSG